MFPIIPLLASLGIIGGIVALDWYYSQTKEKRQKADKLALQWFQRRFTELSEAQQYRIQRSIDEEAEW